MARKSNQKFEKKVKKVIKKMAETKVKDYTLVEFPLRSDMPDPYVQDLTSIAQNDEADGRVGNQIHLSGVKWRLLFHNRNNPNATGVVVKSVWVRMIILQAKNIDDTSVLEKFFRQGSRAIDFTSATEQEKFYLPVDQTNKKTLFQKTFKLGLSNSQYTQNFYSNHILKKYRSINKEINYEEANVANSASNKVYAVMWIGNNDMDATLSNNAGYIEISGGFSSYYKDF